MDAYRCEPDWPIGAGGEAGDCGGIRGRRDALVEVCEEGAGYRVTVDQVPLNRTDRIFAEENFALLVGNEDRVLAFSQACRSAPGTVHPGGVGADDDVEIGLIPGTFVGN